MLISEESQAKLQEMRESHDFCCIILDSDHDYVWDVWLAWSELSRHRPDPVEGVDWEGGEKVHPKFRPIPPGMTYAPSRESLDDAIAEAYDYWKRARKP